MPILAWSRPTATNSSGFLGGAFYNRKDLADTQATIAQQLKAAEEVYGPDSPQLSPVLESMARTWHLC